MIKLSSDYALDYCIFMDESLTPSEIVLLGAIIAVIISNCKKTVPVSMSYLVRLSGLSMTTVRNAFKTLVKLNHIKEALSYDPITNQCRQIEVTSPYLFKLAKRTNKGRTGNTENKMS